MNAQAGNEIICSPRSNRVPIISRDTSALEPLCYTSVGYAISWPTSSILRVAATTVRTRQTTGYPARFYAKTTRLLIDSRSYLPPSLSISPISQSWLLLTLPVTFVCGRIASNVCVCADFLCVARFNAVLYRFWYRHEGKGGGGGEGAITCRLLAWLQSPIVNQGILEGGMAEGAGGATPIK